MPRRKNLEEVEQTNPQVETLEVQTKVEPSTLVEVNENPTNIENEPVQASAPQAEPENVQEPEPEPATEKEPVQKAEEPVQKAEEPEQKAEPEPERPKEEPEPKHQNEEKTEGKRVVLERVIIRSVIEHNAMHAVLPELANYKFADKYCSEIFYICKTMHEKRQRISYETVLPLVKSRSQFVGIFFHARPVQTPALIQFCKELKTMK